MKTFLLVSFFSISMINSIAQIRAVTSTGDEVILNVNGTWQYVNKELRDANTIDTNKIQFKKSEHSTFLIKSTLTDFGIYLNPKKWSFKKSRPEEVFEYQFTSKDNNAYGMFITEKIEIPLKTLKWAALENARAVGPDMQVVKEEYRMVNGKMILLLQMEGTLQGMNITYNGYYYSSSKGTVQFITYTSTNLFKSSKNEMEEFLNGFVTLEK